MPTRRSLERINPSCNFSGTRFSSSSVMVQHIMANNYTPKLAGRILFYALIAFLAFGLWPWRVFSQAGAGYTKLNTSPVTSLTFTDSGVTDGAIYQYQVTARSEEHTSELQSHVNLVCRLLLEKKKNR